MLLSILLLLAAYQVVSQSFSSSTSSSSTTTTTTYYISSYASTPSDLGFFCSGNLDYSFPYISGPLPQCLTITQYNYDLPITICGYYKNGVPASLTTQFVVGNSPALTFYSNYPYATTQYSEAYLQFDLTYFYLKPGHPTALFISLTKVLGTQSYSVFGSNIGGQIGTFLLYAGSSDLQQFLLPGFNNYRYISIVGYNGYPLIYNMYTPCPGPIVYTFPPSRAPIPSPSFQPVSAPSFQPVSKPSFPPVAAPSFQPVSKPTFPPVPPPFFLPVPPPTLPPINDIYVCNCPSFFGYTQQCVIGRINSFCPGGISCPDCRPTVTPTLVPSPVPTKRRPSRRPSRKPTRKPRN